MKKTGRHKIFAQFLLPYILVLLIPLVLGLIIYDKTVNVLESEAGDSNMLLLEQGKEILDRRIAEIEVIVQQLVRDPKIVSFQYIRDPFTGPNTYKVRDTENSLINYGLYNSFISDYYIFFKNSEIVLSKGMIYKFSEFFNQMFRYDHLNYEQWYREILGKYYNNKVLPARDVVIKGQSHSYLAYVQSLGYPNYFQGAVTVLFDDKEIQKLFGGLDISDGGWAYIADKNGDVLSYLTSDGKTVKPVQVELPKGKGVMEKTIDSRTMMITYTASKYNDWTYVVVQSKHIVMEKVDYIKKIIWTILIISLVIGSVAAFLMAYRNSKPVRNLIQTIMERVGSEHHSSGNAYGMIQRTFSKLLDNNEEMQTKMKEHLPIVRTAFFERLFKGVFNTNKDIDTLLEHIGLNITGKGKRYNATVLHLRGYHSVYDQGILKKLDMTKVRIRDLLEQEGSDNVFFHDVEEDKIALLFVCDSGTAVDCKDYLNSMIQMIYKNIFEELQMNTIFTVGGIYEQLIEVSRSYKEAKQAFDLKMWDLKSDIIWFDELPKLRNGYYFPEDIQLRLANLCKMGDKAEVAVILKELYKVNFTERRLSMFMLQLLLSEMWGNIIKLLEQIDIEKDHLFDQIQSMVLQVNSFSDPDKLFQSVTEIYSRICDGINERKTTHKSKLIREIIKYINFSFQNSQLSLTAVADQFLISEVYLSQFFKEQAGTTFSDYLEDLRMKQVRDLLANTELPVNEIAERTGYNSLNSLSRAFKRIHGMSPSLYKRMEDDKAGKK